MGDTASKTAEQHDSGNQQQVAQLVSASFKRTREDVIGHESVPESSVQQESSLVTSSPAASPSTVRKKHRLKGERICRVCGDKAVAHHFDVITCESCKTFFRRNANKTQKVCQFEGRCQVTVKTRRFCPACRLQKCFSIGMRADLIMDEEERKARLEKIRNNRMVRMEAARQEDQMRQRENNRSPCIICSPDANGVSLILQEPDTMQAVQSLLEDMSREITPRDSERQEEEVFTFLDSDEAKHASCSSSGADGIASSPCQLQEMNPRVSSTVTCDSSATIQSGLPAPAQDSLTSSDVQCNWCVRGGLTEARVPEFHPVPKTLLPSDPCMFWTLTAEEEELIKFLGCVFKCKLTRSPMVKTALPKKIMAKENETKQRKKEETVRLRLEKKNATEEEIQKRKETRKRQMEERKAEREKQKSNRRGQKKKKFRKVSDSNTDTSIDEAEMALNDASEECDFDDILLNKSRPT